MADGHQITRAADLTEADIDLLAADAIAVSWWCMRNRIKRLDQQAQVRGKDLARWCPPDQPCHADVLLELANA